MARLEAGDEFSPLIGDGLAGSSSASSGVLPWYKAPTFTFDDFAPKYSGKDRRFPSRSRRCGPGCPICILRINPSRLARWRYRAIAPQLTLRTPPTLTSSSIPKSMQHVTRLEPSSIYTLIYLEHPGIYSYALYFSRSVPWKPGFLCRGTLNHPLHPCGVSVQYHQRKADLSTQTRTLLAAIRIGSLEASISGRKLLRHLAALHIPAHELAAADEHDKWAVWWNAAVNLLWGKGYLDCEGGLDLDLVRGEMEELAREREREREEADRVMSKLSSSSAGGAVAVWDSPWFL